MRIRSFVGRANFRGVDSRRRKRKEKVRKASVEAYLSSHERSKMEMERDPSVLVAPMYPLCFPSRFLLKEAINWLVINMATFSYFCSLESILQTCSTSVSTFVFVFERKY